MSARALRIYSRSKRQQRSTRGELKRKQILDAAAKVLARRGYIGAQLSEIAEEAGTQSGSLYYHFESREQLIEEVLHEGVRLSFARARGVVEAMQQEATPLDRLTAALRAHLKFQLVESDYARAVSRSIGESPEEMWKRVNDKFRAYGRFFDGLIQAAMKSGEIDSRVDRSALRMLLIGAANYTPEWYRRGGSSSVEEIADLLVRLVLRGVGTARRVGRIEHQDAISSSKRAPKNSLIGSMSATRATGG
jgi:TetR/AcrR family transcriptional regulator, cholesterol catabolism regulator